MILLPPGTLLPLIALALIPVQSRSDVDLTRAVVILPPNPSSRITVAAQMLIEEVETRSRVRWPQVKSAWAGQSITLRRSIAAMPPESYSIKTQGSRIEIVGADDRGVLFGVGRLLRELRMRRDKVTLPEGFSEVSQPHSRIRGHQLGYRPKTNSYDGWDARQWEQYIRDLIVFGANSVELIPPRSDDAADSPHFPMPQMRMMEEMSRILDKYGLDVWVWYPALDKSYASKDSIRKAVAEWTGVLRRLPRVDHILVPGGDPGHTPPRLLMNLLARETPAIRKFHPKVGMWVSPQGFPPKWMDEFLTIVSKEQPAWLTGIVFAPQVRLDLPLLRARIPARYPIRHYPDITHTRQCQYPVPDWDVAFAITEARECINPRPEDESIICKRHQLYTVGSITYSEGCNDDVNKAIWSAVEWNPQVDVNLVLRWYARYFIDPDMEPQFARGLRLLERNWRGPADQNTGIPETYALFQSLNSKASPRIKLNWRFQQAQYRATYDAWIHARAGHERRGEAEAIKVLESSLSQGSLKAMHSAEEMLDGTAAINPAPELRARLDILAEALFQSIHMQLSVTKYGAIGVDRGANLDTADLPLNNRAWLKERFSAIRRHPDEKTRMNEIREILSWTDPGPGGFYDEPADQNRRTHLVIPRSYAQDPGFLSSPRVGFEELPGRINWSRHIESLFDAPLTFRYTNLDPNARYKMKIIYSAESSEKKVKCVANGKYVIHELMTKPEPSSPLMFDLPIEATRTGTLELAFTRDPTLGGNGRGSQICEIWILKVN